MQGGKPTNTVKGMYFVLASLCPRYASGGG